MLKYSLQKNKIGFMIGSNTVSGQDTVGWQTEGMSSLFKRHELRLIWKRKTNKKKAS